jgi:hypothetical protein
MDKSEKQAAVFADRDPSEPTLAERLQKVVGEFVQEAFKRIHALDGPEYGEIRIRLGEPQFDDGDENPVLDCQLVVEWDTPVEGYRRDPLPTREGGREVGVELERKT